jgi:hypothetical protein
VQLDPKSITFAADGGVWILNRWDERLAALRQLQPHDGRTDWCWQPQDMSSHAEPAAPK